MLEFIGGGSRSTTPHSLISRKSPSNDMGVQVNQGSRQNDGGNNNNNQKRQNQANQMRNQGGNQNYQRERRDSGKNQELMHDNNNKGNDRHQQQQGNNRSAYSKNVSFFLWSISNKVFAHSNNFHSKTVWIQQSGFWQKLLYFPKLPRFQSMSSKKQEMRVMGKGLRQV